MHTLSSSGKVKQWEHSQAGRRDWSQLFKRNSQDLEGPAQHRLVSVQQVPTEGSVYCLAVHYARILQCKNEKVQFFNTQTQVRNCNTM